MNIKSVFKNNERAVSPVIGVILMVAITVILAAVIGSFVIGLGDNLGDSQPNAQLELTGDDDGGDGDDMTIDIAHDGGDTLRLSEFELQVNKGSSESDSADLDKVTSEDTLSVGESATVKITTDGGDGDPTIDNVRLIHKPSDTIFVDQTLVLNNNEDLGEIEPV